MNPARREPLLWLQLLGLAALPLEALLLLLVLAGADPGPLPGFERVLAWALGGLAPAVLFWRLPPDLWSLLVLQVPLRGRRPEQLRLSALQTALPLKVIAAAGAGLLLPLVWLMDASAGLAWAWSPLSASPRLVVLLVSLPLLSLMLWHWHQLVQTLWLFSRPASLVEETLPLSQAQAAESRLSVGLPLLLLPPLAIEAPVVVSQEAAVAEPQVMEPLDPTPTNESEEPAPELSEPIAESAGDSEADAVESEAVEAEAVEADVVESGVVVIEAGVAIPPEEPAEQHEGANLDAEVAEGDGIPG